MTVVAIEVCIHCGHDREAHTRGPDNEGEEHCLDCWRDDGPTNDRCEFEGHDE